MTTRIQLRGDTESQWSSINPVLAAREIGIDTTNNEIRVGNGADVWTDLPVIGSTDPGAGGGEPSGAAGGDLSGTYPNPSVIAASSTTAGKVELATSSEAVEGTDPIRAVTPAGVKAALDAGYQEAHTFTVSGDVYTTIGSHRLYVEKACVVDSVRASLGAAPMGSSMIVDVNRNGATIYGTQTNRPTIASSGTTATGGAASNGILNAGDYLTVDVDQIGSSAAGSNLTVTVRLRKA